MTTDELERELADDLKEDARENIAIEGADDDEKRDKSMENIAHSIAKAIKNGEVSLKKVSCDELNAIEDKDDTILYLMSDSGVLAGDPSLSVSEGDIVRWDGKWTLLAGGGDTPSPADVYSKAETDSRINSAVGAEASRASTNEQSLAIAINSIRASVGGLYNSEVEGVTDETSVTSSTSGRVKTFVVGLATSIKSKIEAAYAHIANMVNTLDDSATHYPTTHAVTAAIGAEATARESADSALGTRIDNEATAREDADATLQSNIESEATEREQADSELQAQIDAISSKSDVVDVVASYAELVAYDTSTLADNDVIKVLADETHEDAIAYYRWSTTTEAWSFIGSQGPYYTISEADTLLAGKAPTNHASTATTYGVGDATKYGHVKVDSALSATSTNPVQNKEVTAELALKTDIPWKGYVSGINFNSYSAIGIYGIAGGNCTNAPVRDVWGNLYVTHGYANNNVKYQIYIGSVTGGSSMFIRQTENNGSSWTAWTACMTLQGGNYNPIGNLSPSAAGFVFHDKQSNVFYLSYGTSTNDWKEIFTKASTIPLANGGTGSTTAADARTNLGLGNVENESVSNGTPDFTEASTRTNIASGEKMSVLFGKIKKWFTDLKTVAFTGSYNDLVDKPTIPAGQVQSDWNETGTSEPSFIKNKPQNLVQDASYVHTDNNYTTAEKTKLAGIDAGAQVNNVFVAVYNGNHNHAGNTPYADINAAYQDGKRLMCWNSASNALRLYTLNGFNATDKIFKFTSCGGSGEDILEVSFAYLEGNINSTECQAKNYLLAKRNHASSDTTYGTGTSSNYGHVKLSDSTSSTSGTSGGVAATPSAVKAAYDLANGKYSKPSGGIPKSDLASAVQTSLGLADSALQQHQSLDGYVNNIQADSTTTFGDTSTIVVGKSGKNILTRTASALWTYIKGKADSVYAALSHTHSVKINGITKTIAASGETAVDLGTYLTDHQDISGKEDTSNKVTTLDSSTTHYPSCSAVQSAIASENSVKRVSINGSTITPSGGTLTLDNYFKPFIAVIQTVTSAELSAARSLGRYIIGYYNGDWFNYSVGDTHIDPLDHKAHRIHVFSSFNGGSTSYPTVAQTYAMQIVWELHEIVNESSDVWSRTIGTVVNDSNFKSFSLYLINTGIDHTEGSGVDAKYFTSRDVYQETFDAIRARKFPYVTFQGLGTAGFPVFMTYVNSGTQSDGTEFIAMAGTTSSRRGNAVVYRKSSTTPPQYYFKAWFDQVPLENFAEDSTHQLVTSTEKEVWNNKMGKVSSAVENNLATFNSSGQVIDSGSSKDLLNMVGNLFSKSYGSGSTAVGCRVLRLPATSDFHTSSFIVRITNRNSNSGSSARFGEIYAILSVSHRGSYFHLSFNSLSAKRFDGRMYASSPYITPNENTWRVGYKQVTVSGVNYYDIYLWAVIGNSAVTIPFTDILMTPFDYAYNNGASVVMEDITAAPSVNDYWSLRYPVTHNMDVTGGSADRPAYVNANGEVQQGNLIINRGSHSTVTLDFTGTLGSNANTWYFV